MITIDINGVQGFHFFDAFEETKHPRAKSGATGGQFVKKGGEGAGSGGGGSGFAPPEPKTQLHGKPIGHIKQLSISEAQPHDAAAKIKAVSAMYAHPSIASYANTVLKGLEQHHSLAPGSLGKAMNATGGKMPPIAMPTTPAPAPVAKPATPAPVAPKPAPSPAVKELPEKPMGSPLSNQLHEIALSSEPPATKIQKLKDFVNSTVAKGQDPTVTLSGKYATALIKHFGEENYTPPKAAPSSVPAAAPAPPNPSLLSTKGEITTPNPQRLKRAQDAYNAAHQFTNAADSNAQVQIPSLKSAFWQTISGAQRQAAKHYTGGGYTPINIHLRNPDATVDPDVVSEINHLDELFEHPSARVNNNVVLRRGETVPPDQLAKWEKALGAGLPVRFSKDGFISGSAAKSPGFGHKNVYLEMTVKKGTPALGLFAISSHKHENEVLLRHGQAFEIFAMRKEGDRTIIRMVTT